jgi:hypothetical protein
MRGVVTLSVLYRTVKNTASVFALRGLCVGLACAPAMVPSSSSAAEQSVVSRTAFSTTTRSGDQFKTVMSAEPVNFKDEHGAWQKVDTSLEAAGSGTVAAAAVDGTVTIPSKASDHVVIEHEGDEVSLKLVGAQDGSDRRVVDSTASFDGVLPGVSTSYTATAQGVKELVRLGSDAARVLRYDLRGPDR